MTRKNLILIVVRAFLKIRVFGLRSLTLLSGDMTSGEMTFERLDRKALRNDLSNIIFIQKTYSVMILIEMVLLD